MITLLPHQKEFVQKNPRKAILAHGVRVGKTYTMCYWMHNYPDVHFMLVCPKRLKEQWQEHLRETKTHNASVLTKEEVKKYDLSPYDGLVADEAHHLASGLFRPHKTSELTRVVYNWVREHPDAPVLLATATPIASMPANVHTLAALTGRYIDAKKFKDKFYHLVSRPYAPRPFWEPRLGWQKAIQPLAAKLCHIKQLSDVTDVPPTTHAEVSVSLTKKTKDAIAAIHDPEPAKEWVERHKRAQYEEKLQKVRELSAGEPKSIIVAKYKDQIAYYAKHLAKDREVVTLTGDTKDQPAALTRAHEMSEGYLIAQADTLEGFRGDTFGQLIFASMSWRRVSYEQSLGRLLHLDKTVGADVYYLLADGKDKKVYEKIQQGKDFTIAAIARAKKTA